MKIEGTHETKIEIFINTIFIYKDVKKREMFFVSKYFLFYNFVDNLNFNEKTTS